MEHQIEHITVAGELANARLVMFVFLRADVEIIGFKLRQSLQDPVLFVAIINGGDILLSLVNLLVMLLVIQQLFGDGI